MANYVDISGMEGDVNAEYEDFGSEDLIDVTNSVNNDNPIDKERKHRRKTNVLSAGFSIGMAITPLVIKKIRNDKAGLPTIITKGDILNIAVRTIPNLVLAADDIALGGKIQSTSYGNAIKHCRNIVNIVNIYMPLHDSLNRELERQKIKNVTVMPNEQRSFITKSVIASTVELVSPYIINNLCDSSLSLREKINTIAPLPIIGNQFRNIMQATPQTRQIYDKISTFMSFTSSGTHLIGNAVRSSSNSNVKKGMTSVSNIVDTFATAVGANRGNNYSWGDDYNYRKRHNDPYYNNNTYTM